MPKFEKGHKPFPRSLAGRLAMKEKMSGDKNPMKRPDVVAKNSAARKGNNGKTDSKQSEATKKKISAAHKGKKKPWAGKFLTEKGRASLRARRGELCPNWKGGLTPVHQAIRNSAEYKDWRMSVFERDGFTCVFCLTKGGHLQADHIKRFSDYPELRFVLENGRTLCVPCHKLTPTYGNRL